MFLGLVQDLTDKQIKPLTHFNKHWSLAKNNDVITLVSNVCPHQNSLLTNNVCEGVMTCPYHGLKFDSLGFGVGNNYVLDVNDVTISHGMIFNDPVQFEFPIDLSDMTLVEQRVDFIHASPEIFMDVFLDIDHIPVAHPGVYDKIDITDVSKIKYEFFAKGSQQFVYADSDSHIHAQDKSHELGALWTAVYPNTTIEWQPGALFVNVAIEHNNGSNVIVFKYRDSKYSQDVWTLNNNIWEEAWRQDRELCEQIVSLPENNLSPLKSHHLHYVRGKK